MRIAVIGSGISGSLAARLLSTAHEVTLFEANATVGGHANTVDVAMDGRSFPVDTGFMVFNDRTYPNFCRMLQLLGVESQASDMSFSVCVEHAKRAQLEYQGSSLNGLFAQRRNLVKPSFWRMLRDIVRFNRAGLQAVASGELKDGRSLAQFLEQLQVGPSFIDHYLVPMAAAIWSSDPRGILDFPADFLLGFYANHGLLELRNRPQWRTICGGSRVYLDALLDPIRDQIRTGCPVLSVVRDEQQVQVVPQGEPAEYFEHVVLATHADQTLRILAEPTDDERRILQAFPYQPNEAVLHTDRNLLPKTRRAWASWNYRVPSNDRRVASLTYDLSRLQRHDTSTPILVTLNETERIDPQQILQTFNYHHPAYSKESVEAQGQRSEIQGKQRTHFCGAYWGYGFHEDGVNSALAVAQDFDIGLEACIAASTKGESGIVAASQ